MGHRFVDRREIQARLDLPVVRSLLQKGYSVTDVKEVIENRLRTTGNYFIINNYVYNIH